MHCLLWQRHSQLLKQEGPADVCNMRELHWHGCACSLWPLLHMRHLRICLPCASHEHAQDYNSSWLKSALPHIKAQLLHVSLGYEQVTLAYL